MTKLSGHREPSLYGTLKLKEWLWLPIPFHVSSHCLILDLTKVYFSIYQKTNAIKYMTFGVVGTEDRDVTGILETLTDLVTGILVTFSVLSHGIH